MYIYPFVILFKTLIHLSHCLLDIIFTITQKQYTIICTYCKIVLHIEKTDHTISIMKLKIRFISGLSRTIESRTVSYRQKVKHLVHAFIPKERKSALLSLTTIDHFLSIPFLLFLTQQPLE